MNFVAEWYRQIGAPVEGPEQVGTGERVVDQHRYTFVVGDLGPQRQIEHFETGITECLGYDQLGVVPERGLIPVDVTGADKRRIDTKAGRVWVRRLLVPPYTLREHTTWSPAQPIVDTASHSAAIPLAVATAPLPPRRCLPPEPPPSPRKRPRSGLRSGVDVTLAFEVEQSGGMIDIAKQVRSGLINRYRPGTEVAVRPVPGMECKRLELEEIRVYGHLAQASGVSLRLRSALLCAKGRTSDALTSRVCAWLCPAIFSYIDHMRSPTRSVFAA